MTSNSTKLPHKFQVNIFLYVQTISKLVEMSKGKLSFMSTSRQFHLKQHEFLHNFYTESKNFAIKFNPFIPDLIIIKSLYYIHRGLCCQLQRRHRQAPRKVSTTIEFPIIKMQN